MVNKNIGTPFPPENERIRPLQKVAIWKGHESSSKHQFSGDIRSLSGE